VVPILISVVVIAVIWNFRDDIRRYIAGTSSGRHQEPAARRTAAWAPLRRRYSAIRFTAPTGMQDVQLTKHFDAGASRIGVTPA
jgi:hypothetical protein